MNPRRLFVTQCCGLAASIGLGVGAVGQATAGGLLAYEVGTADVGLAYGDGQLRLDDNTWGWGGTLALLYEINPGTRIGLTWSSQVDLDFEFGASFTDLAPGLGRLLDSRGLLDSTFEVGIKAPQQVMASLFAEVNPDWAVLGRIGWQEWSKFGQVQLGIAAVAGKRRVAIRHRGAAAAERGHLLGVGGGVPLRRVPRHQLAEQHAGRAGRPG